MTNFFSEQTYRRFDCCFGLIGSSIHFCGISGMGTGVGYDNRIEPVLPTVLFEEKAFELEMI